MVFLKFSQSHLACGFTSLQLSHKCMRFLSNCYPQNRGWSLSKFSLHIKFPYLKFFWFVFSRIRTEYGKILRIQSECRKRQTRKTPNKDTFHSVLGLSQVNFNLKITCKSKCYLTKPLLQKNMLPFSRFCVSIWINKNFEIKRFSIWNVFSPWMIFTPHTGSPQSDP